MELFDNDDDLALLEEAEEETKDYPPYIANLDEKTVQAIFDKCLAKDGMPKEKITFSLLFSRTMGYKPEDEHMLFFDKEEIIKDKKNILYLYGQLKNSHTKKENLKIEDTFVNYEGKNWTKNKGILLELLYLGCNNETNAISLFNTQNNSAALNFSNVKPTLSPKDPNFPAWWETHKSEWE